MLRKPMVIVTSFVLLAAVNPKALGLGDISLESARNKPLQAYIALVQFDAARAGQISEQVALVSASDFKRFSIDSDATLDSFNLDVRPAGAEAEAVVQVSTQATVREPYVSFELETCCPSDRLLSEHTVLFDLPVFVQDVSVPAIQQPVQQSAPRFSSLKKSINQSVQTGSSSNLRSQPIRLAAPAELVSAGPAPVEVPASGLVAQLDANAGADAARPVNAAAAPAPQSPPAPAATPGPLAAPADAQTLTTDVNDTLWDIALRVRPDSSVSVQQTMLAIQRLNTNAFIGDNINMIRRGQVLRLPDIEQIRALSAREAMREVARQNQLFENRRDVPLTSQPLTPPPSAATAIDSAPRGELSVVSVENAAPGSQTVSGQSAELDARIASLEDVLAVQREEADRASLLSAELTERLGLLEEQIASAQEIIRLRDLELAQLQESLANAPALESLVEEPPTVITMAPERSFFETLLESLVADTAALLAVTAMIISLLVFILIRRNRAAEHAAALAGMDGLTAQPRSLEDLPVVGAAEGHQRIALGAEGPKASESKDPLFEEVFDIATSTKDKLKQPAPAETRASLAPASVEKGVENASAMVADALVLNAPLSPSDTLLEEVSALLTQSRYPEAIARLQVGVQVQPLRTDLRLKLLEAFAGTRDVLGFESQATQLRDLFGDALTPQIVALRASLGDELLEQTQAETNEDKALAGDLEIATVLEANSEVDHARLLAGVNIDEDSDNPVDIDFVMSVEKDEPLRALEEDSRDSLPDSAPSAHEVDCKGVPPDGKPESATPIAVETAMDGKEDLVDIDGAVFKLVDEHDVVPLAAAATTARGYPETGASFDDLQFVDETLLDSLENPEADKSAEEDDVFEYLSHADEAAAKLDLARAYFEMGDSAGAREILEEVLREGNEEQVKYASSLLSKL
jgi:pilus assembly protein FimV